MKLAIMQPYFFPYIGYFQLISAVDKFIFYDDVNYIKGGWINRNRILINGKVNYITLNLCGSSSNKLIKDISLAKNNSKLVKKIYQAYSKSPYIDQVMPLIEEILEKFSEENSISEVAASSIMAVCDYLELDTEFEFSSKLYSETKKYARETRLIEICKKNNVKTYINAKGGQKLYSKENFQTQGIKLMFMKNGIDYYSQFNNDFVAGLSIIDVMMFNSPDSINEMLNNYELI